jgi:hypothetical protein
MVRTHKGTIHEDMDPDKRGIINWAVRQAEKETSPVP